MKQKELIGLIRESIGKVLISEQSEYQWAEERRQRDDWKREDLHSGDLGSSAHALYNFLRSEGEIGDDKDVYDIIPMGSEYSMYLFATTDDLDTQWIVGTSDDAFQSAKDYLSDLIDSEGLGTLFSTDFVSGYVDNDEYVRFIRGNFEDSVRDEPESYLEDDMRELSEKQMMFVQYLELKIQKLGKKLESATDQDERESIHIMINNTQEKIDEIQDDPQGEFSEERIEAAIDNLVDQYYRDPESFFNDWWGEFDVKVLVRNNLIDIDELIDDAVSNDGAAHTLNTYDGTSYEVRFEGDTYEIMVWDR
jgi:hypothetical protein